MVCKVENYKTTSKTLNCLIYGRSGSGKTVFSSTAPDVLCLDAEGGLLSVQDKNPAFIKINDYDDLLSAYEFIKTGKHEFKTIVLDSLTEISKKIMQQILKVKKADMPIMQDWGIWTERIRKLIMSFRDLPYNLIVTALLKQDKDEETGAIIFMPSLEGKISNDISAFFDEVFYLLCKDNKDEKGLEKIDRFLLTSATKKYIAKDRSGKLSMYEKPDFQDIYNKIYGIEGGKPEIKE